MVIVYVWCEHCRVIYRTALYTGKAFDPEELESALEAITAKTVREACMEYIYDKCPAVVGYGQYLSLNKLWFVTSGFVRQTHYGV